MVGDFARLVKIDSSLDGAIAASPIDLEGGAGRVDEDDLLQKAESMNHCRYRITIAGV
jgi:hypothetical protein